MSKSDILRLVREYLDLKPIIEKEIINFQAQQSIKTKALLAEELGIRDSSGRIDFEQTELVLEKTRLDTARKLYILTKAHLELSHNEDLLWSENLEKNNWNNHIVIFSYCYKVLIIIRIIPKHDQSHVAVVESHDGIPLTTTYIGEKERESSGEETKEEKYGDHTLST